MNIQNSASEQTKLKKKKKDTGQRDDYTTGCLLH